MQPTSHVPSLLGDYNDNDESWSEVDFLTEEDAREPAKDYDPVKENWRDFLGLETLRCKESGAVVLMASQDP